MNSHILSLILEVTSITLKNNNKKKIEVDKRYTEKYIYEKDILKRYTEKERLNCERHHLRYLVNDLKDNNEKKN